MNKIFKFSGILIVFSALVIASCTKMKTEITSVEASRLFSQLIWMPESSTKLQFD